MRRFGCGAPATLLGVLRRKMRKVSVVVSCGSSDAMAATAALIGEEEMMACGGFATEDGGAPVSPEKNGGVGFGQGGSA
jgi:hypothetical protein